MSRLAREILLKYWGYPSFRPLQEEIVDSAIAGRDTLALLPTGGGKSICFQVPTLSTEGVCIVITPLIALMKDQVLHLKNKGISAAAIYSGMHQSEIEIAYNKAVFGQLKFLYVSPERLVNDQFREAVNKMKVNLIAVDESHCISQWGYDFRPPYLRIAELRPYAPQAPILALTATATPKVVDDIQLRLNFKEKNVIQGSFERKNVTYNVIKDADKYGHLFRILSATTEGSAIVYVRNRKRTKAISDWLQSVGISSTYYHAGLDAAVRDEHQDLWMKDKVRAIVATNAFGMGIDKPTVRSVVHMDLPDSIEAYFQEAGRAGRDLKESQAYLIVSEADITKLKENLATSYPEMGKIRTIYQAIGNYLNIPVGAGQGQTYPFVMTDFAKKYNFNLLEVFSSLQLIEREGYISMSEAMEKKSRIFIKANREDLYRFQVQHPEFDNFIKYLLRNFPGILSDFVNIDENISASKLGITADQVVQKLEQLKKLNFIEYIPQSDKPQITFVTEFIGKDMALSNGVYRDRKADAVKRIQSIIDFVNNDTECRSVQLLRYFGENIRRTCKKCDVCTNNKLTDNDFDRIKAIITTRLSTADTSIEDILLIARPESSEKVIDTIRYLIDNKVVARDENDVLRLL